MTPAMPNTADVAVAKALLHRARFVHLVAFVHVTHVVRLVPLAVVHWIPLGGVLHAVLLLHGVGAFHLVHLVLGKRARCAEREAKGGCDEGDAFQVMSFRGCGSGCGRCSLGRWLRRFLTRHSSIEKGPAPPATSAARPARYN